MKNTTNNYKVNIEFIDNGNRFYTHSESFKDEQNAYEFAQAHTTALKNNGFRYFITVLKIDEYKTAHAITLFNSEV